MFSILQSLVDPSLKNLGRHLSTATVWALWFASISDLPFVCLYIVTLTTKKVVFFQGVTEASFDWVIASHFSIITSANTFSKFLRNNWDVYEAFKWTLILSINFGQLKWPKRIQFWLEFAFLSEEAWVVGSYCGVNWPVDHAATHIFLLLGSRLLRDEILCSNTVIYNLLLISCLLWRYLRLKRRHIKIFKIYFI